MKTIIFVDGDNFSYRKLNEAMEYIGFSGDVGIKIFANQLSIVSKWASVVDNALFNGIEFVKSRFNKKNSSDIQIIIHAMDVLHTEDYDRFVFMTGDSDFIPLIQSVRKAKKIVSVVCGQNASKDMIGLCSDFYVVKDSQEDSLPPAVIPKNNQKAKVVSLVNEYIRKNSKGYEGVHYAIADANIIRALLLTIGVELGRSDFQKKLRYYGFTFKSNKYILEVKS
jgi:uncharacterized LabA/DUF88 family protein